MAFLPANNLKKIHHPSSPVLTREILCSQLFPALPVSIRSITGSNYQLHAHPFLSLCCCCLELGSSWLQISAVWLLQPHVSVTLMPCKLRDSGSASLVEALGHLWAGTEGLQWRLEKKERMLSACHRPPAAADHLRISEARSSPESHPCHPPGSVVLGDVVLASQGYFRAFFSL